MMEPEARAYPPDVSLDPTDWPGYRAVAREALEVALDTLQTVGQGPVWRPVPDSVRQALTTPCPMEPEGPAAVLKSFRQLVLPYATGNIHPRFWGWVHGTGTAGGVVSELLTAAMNANVGGRDHGAVYVERQVIDWCRDLFDLPSTTSGLLVSGTSMATVIALTVARNHALQRRGVNARQDGLRGAPALVTYASSEVHVAVRKALELLGLGAASLCTVPADPAGRLDLGALRACVAGDRAAGLVPFCVVATAGTVNTGAVDDLAGAADLCRDEGLWLHVDGAFGALVRLAPALAHTVHGIHRADSLAFDFHKWLHVPYDAGCVLVRDGDLHLQTFTTHPPYLAHGQALAGGEPWYCDYGPELSRGFRALRVWWTLREHGLRRLGEKIQENCDQARYLAARVNAHADLELAAPVALNIVCFRYVGTLGGSPAALDGVQESLVAALHREGIAAPSTTRVHGRTVIRCAITNHRSRLADLDTLIAAVVRLGAAHADTTRAPR